MEINLMNGASLDYNVNPDSSHNAPQNIRVFSGPGGTGNITIEEGTDPNAAPIQDQRSVNIVGSWSEEVDAMFRNITSEGSVLCNVSNVGLSDLMTFGIITNGGRLDYNVSNANMGELTTFGSITNGDRLDCNVFNVNVGDVEAFGDLSGAVENINVTATQKASYVADSGITVDSGSMLNVSLSAANTEVKRDRAAFFNGGCNISMTGQTQTFSANDVAIDDASKLTLYQDGGQVTGTNINDTFSCLAFGGLQINACVGGNNNWIDSPATDNVSVSVTEMAGSTGYVSVYEGVNPSSGDWIDVGGFWDPDGFYTPRYEWVDATPPAVSFTLAVNDQTGGTLGGSNYTVDGAGSDIANDTAFITANVQNPDQIPLLSSLPPQ
jgi:hypothetical protein